MNTSFTFIDLFAGIGGFHEALRSVGGKCLAACEIDMQARETYLANHQVPEEMFFKDINNINPNNIPNHDILCAGFPCQPFSISGKQKALNDERSRVIHSLFNIIKEKKPKVVILENVKHLRYISKGEVFAFLTKTLEEIGYNVTAKLINAKDYEQRVAYPSAARKQAASNIKKLLSHKQYCSQLNDCNEMYNLITAKDS